DEKVEEEKIARAIAGTHRLSVLALLNTQYFRRSWLAVCVRDRKVVASFGLVLLRVCNRIVRLLRGLCRLPPAVGNCCTLHYTTLHYTLHYATCTPMSRHMHAHSDFRGGEVRAM
ncbi:unnamed protein product, partial [Hapterophycus canaliculatus]